MVALLTKDGSGDVEAVCFPLVHLSQHTPPLCQPQ